MILIILYLGESAAFAAPPSWDFSEFKLLLEQLERQVHVLQVEINLLHENYEEVAQKERSCPSLEKRLFALEKSQEKLAGDLKKIKDTVAGANSRLAVLETQYSEELGILKSSLSSLLMAVKNEGQNTYTVQEGDSLGKIAQQKKIPVTTLKNLNHLKDDRIYPGQKLLLS